ncbi:MAG: Periplasmic copper-binding protein (NosD) [Candidatus Argoarchaeum ethanivorans]|uniref:Periplasmic copper-binding protein (NosD) n=1 Tax=Candidatus Argoarchaeum ethanivorans TaxID=2608793 RepID=A0A811TCA6_9EURY|nr:MAG: Periplasmic copper-binding protein (NosD) [Candidatus Argoarchaeum ethanivorans]
MNKHLTIRSENGSANCIVSASNLNDHVFEVTRDYVNISGFTVENATKRAGIYFHTVEHCNISYNNVTNNDGGIRLYYSSNNTLINNIASNNYHDGIYLKSSSNNTLINNTASNNYYDDICSSICGIYLYDSSNNNHLYRNNFINNTNHNAYDYDTITNQWNTSTVGNYYSDYTGSDNKSDGIGDTLHQIPGGSSIDYFPLMHPWGKSPLKGDLDDDSQITSKDAAIVLQIAVGNCPCNPQILAIADVSGDGRVSSLDALMILQMAT